MLDSIAKAFQDGGEFMYFITLTSAFAWAIILERAWVLMVRYRADNRAIFGALESAMKRGRADAKEIQAVEKYGNSPVAKIAISALRRIDSSARFIQDRVFETYLNITPDVNRRTGFLNMLGNVATLLGLLGTILGLIQAFAGVAAADPSEKQALLASGIAVAMNTTAYGLMVAIPCLIAHAILSARAGRILAEVDAIRSRVQGWVDEHQTSAS